MSDKLDEETERELDAFTSTILGVAPDDFNTKAARAAELCVQINKWELDNPSPVPVDDDVMLIAGLAQYLAQNNAPHAAGFHLRAKQIAKWLAEPKSELHERLVAAEKAGRSLRGDRELLENKSTEIARQVARRLYTDEGFLLLVFHMGGGWVTHTSSANREGQIDILEKHLRFLRGQKADA
jgi:hypothetical protein